MVTELQFIAVAAFLIWGLASSLCGLLKPDVDEESHAAQQPQRAHQHRREQDGVNAEVDIASDITFPDNVGQAGAA